MTIEIVGSYLVLKCPNCKAEITELMKPRTKQNLRRKRLKCPLCGSYIE